MESGNDMWCVGEDRDVCLLVEECCFVFVLVCVVFCEIDRYMERDVVSLFFMDCY